jgi:hypothetical protein
MKYKIIKLRENEYRLLSKKSFLECWMYCGGYSNLEDAETSLQNRLDYEIKSRQDKLVLQTAKIIRIVTI